jgi:hypothetical protein
VESEETQTLEQVADGLKKKPEKVEINLTTAEGSIWQEMELKKVRTIEMSNVVLPNGWTKVQPVKGFVRAKDEESLVQMSQSSVGARTTLGS